jgi:flagellar biosynthesis protein
MSQHDQKRAAAALVYEPGSTAPEITAAVRGDLVQKLLAVAEDYNVPVMKNPVLAEALSGMAPGSFVPEALFAAVAEVFVYCAGADSRLREKIEECKGVGDE